jgi:hypothetical protein
VDCICEAENSLVVLAMIIAANRGRK